MATVKFRWLEANNEKYIRETDIRNLLLEVHRMSHTDTQRDLLDYLLETVEKLVQK